MQPADSWPCAQVEDLSQQVHRAAAEKFKVPAEPAALVPESAPGPQVRPECEEDDEEVRPGIEPASGGAWGRGQLSTSLLPPRWMRQDWSCVTLS